MFKLPSIAIAASLFLVSTTAFAAGEPTMAAGIYGSVVPSATGGVDQAMVRSLPAYNSNERLKNVGWWFCGQSATATAINYLRGNSVSDKTKTDQLNFFHTELRQFQNGYADNQVNPHKEASIDSLHMVMTQRKSEEFESEQRSGGNSPEGRAYARDLMLKSLQKKKTVVVVLSMINVGGTNFGHFYTVYKVDYAPKDATGGTAYYWDSYNATTGKMPLKTLMDGMQKNGRYSILRVTKRFD